MNPQQQLDPSITALTKALGKQESGGDYNKIGDNGHSKGAYQWNNPTPLKDGEVPANFRSFAQAVGENPDDFSPANQDKVAYKTVESWGKQGLNPAQIASKWNSGDPDAYKRGHAGYNASQGYSYDTKAHVDQVAKHYEGYLKAAQASGGMSSGLQTPTIEQQKQTLEAEGKPISVKEDRVEPTMGGQLLRGLLKVPVQAGVSAARGVAGLFNKDIRDNGLTLHSKFLGDVPDYLTQMDQSVANIKKNYDEGNITGAGAVLRGVAAAAKPSFDLATTIMPGSALAGGAGKILPTIPKVALEAAENLKNGIGVGKAALTGVKSAGRGAVLGAGIDLENQLAEGGKVDTGQVLTSGLLGSALDVGATTALPGAANLLRKGKDTLKGTGLVGKVDEQDFSKAMTSAEEKVNQSFGLTKAEKRKQDMQRQGFTNPKTGETANGVTDTQFLIMHDAIPSPSGGKWDVSKSREVLEDLKQPYIDAKEQWVNNEHGLFNLDEAIDEAVGGIDHASASARKQARSKILKEIDDLVAEGVPVVKNEKGQRMVKADVMERLRTAANDWTPFDISDPERIRSSAGYALGNAIRNNVEKYGTFPAYRQFNKEFGRIMSAESFLNNLATKTPRKIGGLSGEISRKTLLGLVGFKTGGVLGAVFSNLGGDALIELASDPALRTIIERRIIAAGKKPDRPAIEQLTREITDMIAQRKQQLALPAPRPSSEVPIPMGGASSVEAPAQKITQYPKPEPPAPKPAKPSEYEPYIPDSELPVIQYGKAPKKRGTKGLPTIRYK